MLEHVASGDLIKLYLQGGADITGVWDGFGTKRNIGFPGRAVDYSVLAVTNLDGRRIRVLLEAVVAVVEL